VSPRGTQRQRRPQRYVFSAVVAAAALIVSACGKKGPPLPPLVKLPVPPAEVAAERRGATVDVQFTVPATNTDNTRPANVSRVDVYAYTGPATLADDLVLKHATPVGRVAVKAPRDPDQTIDPDEPAADAEPPEGAGLDQGARAHVAEELTAADAAPIDLPKDAKPKPSEPAAAGPLLPPPAALPTRVYVAVGVTTRGRRGPLSKRASVPLVAPPPAPPSPTIVYDERTVTVKWKPVTSADGAGSDDLLPARPIGAVQRSLAYNVYDATTKARLTPKPVTDTEFADARIEWGAERCYTIRTAETLAGVTIESEAQPPTCVTLTDTFPPAAPANLQSSPGEGAITLIWDANTEKDLAGYLVFRAAGAGPLEQLTPMPVTEPTFRDEVARDTVMTYAVKAVDTAGNVSPLSNQVRDTAR
jgi:predicted small lipoprotein YifL